VSLLSSLLGPPRPRMMPCQVAPRSARSCPGPRLSQKQSTFYLHLVYTCRGSYGWRCCIRFHFLRNNGIGNSLQLADSARPRRPSVRSDRPSGAANIMQDEHRFVKLSEGQQHEYEES